MTSDRGKESVPFPWNPCEAQCNSRETSCTWVYDRSSVHKAHKPKQANMRHSRGCITVITARRFPGEWPLRSLKYSCSWSNTTYYILLGFFLHLVSNVCFHFLSVPTCACSDMISKSCNKEEVTKYISKIEIPESEKVSWILTWLCCWLRRVFY